MTVQRMDFGKAFPEGFRGVLGLEKSIATSGLEQSLVTLVKLRASQLNGCAYCLDMHAREAREAGETFERLDVVGAWREIDDRFTARERAALALTEQITLISHGGVSDDVWNDVRAEFSDREVGGLIAAINAINVWNRIAISTHQQPGH
ncbi:carboxymuconolactone decarboxylase family protein [Microbacterium sp.]|uniref:carboxymuconolactone decarboxylase family protein n=1 Tax=Microbacterium sp. TaxID=51671 RepID=UPI003A9059CB